MSDQDFSGKQVGRYLLSSIIGYGAAGNVYQAVDTTLQDSPIFAIKCIQESPNARRHCQQIAEVENHHAVVGSPNVMKLYDAIEEGGYFFLVFPLCETDMFRAIWKGRVYWRNDGLIKQVFLDVLDGVLACHRKGVYHRDLKPENIMCSTDGMNIQIGDFGLSTHRRLCRDGGCGTVPYMSPECLDDDEIFYYANPADIWSLGVILFNMVTCRYPWEEARPTDKNYVAFCSTRDHLLCTSPISESLNDLLFKIWHPTPLRRMSIPAIRQAIVEMDTFYRPYQRRPPCALPPLSTVVVPIDSQQTCVAPVEGEKREGSYSLANILANNFLAKVPLCYLA